MVARIPRGTGCANSQPSPHRAQAVRGVDEGSRSTTDSRVRTVLSCSLQLFRTPLFFLRRHQSKSTFLLSCAVALFYLFVSRIDAVVVDGLWTVRCGVDTCVSCSSLSSTSHKAPGVCRSRGVTAYGSTSSHPQRVYLGAACLLDRIIPVYKSPRWPVYRSHRCLSTRTRSELKSQGPRGK